MQRTLSSSLLALLCLLLVAGPSTLLVQAQDYRKFNMSGMHAFRGPVPNKNLKTLVSFGRGFLATFADPDCASTPACRDEAVALTSKVGDCTGHTFYEGLGMMGLVCFGTPSICSVESDKATLATLRALALLEDVIIDKRVRLRLPPAPSNETMAAASTGPEGEQQRRRQPATPLMPGNPRQSNRQEAEIMATPYNWGRDRMNQVYSSLDQRTGTCASRGQGVRIYVLDTGCRTSHVEFRTCLTCSSRRATTESVRLSDGYRPYGTGGDNNGHGTHVAAFAAGLQVGMAPAATVKCIKVLGGDGSGSLSGIVGGMDMVSQAKRASPNVPMVVNLSLGSGYSNTVNTAVGRLASLGVMVVVAAGNEGQDASRTSPASASSAITVGASTTSDRRTSWSNYGSVVDVYAPGESILSASYSGDSYYVRMSGTSMASPGVAGEVACILGAATGSRCSSSNTVVGKIRNPRVEVSQPGGSKPLAYVAEGSRVSCP